MTLEEAIAHHRWAADNCVGEVSDEHSQMAAWLEELVRLKRENAKLRELVQELLTDPDAWDYDYFKWRMRELGVRLDDA